MSARRSLASGALGLGLLLGPLAGSAAAQVAGGGPTFFEPPDAQRLASELAQARERQGICYGWSIRVTGAGEDATDVGSDAGPGTSVQQQDSNRTCDRWAQVEVSITFTDESSEAEDSAGVVITTSPSLNWQPDWNDLGITQADLLGDRDYAAMSNLVAGLPLLAAQDGVADSVEPAAANAPAPPASDAPFGNPGPDLWRELGFAIAFFALLGVVGIVWFVVELVKQRRQRSHAQHNATAAGAAPKGESAKRRRRAATRASRRKDPNQP